MVVVETHFSVQLKAKLNNYKKVLDNLRSFEWFQIIPIW